MRRRGPGTARGRRARRAGAAPPARDLRIAAPAWKTKPPPRCGRVARASLEAVDDGAAVERPGRRRAASRHPERLRAALRVPPGAADHRQRRGRRRRTAPGARRARRRAAPSPASTSTRAGAAAEHRAVADRRVQHARRAARRCRRSRAPSLLAAMSMPRRAAADQLPCVARLQAHLARRRRRGLRPARRSAPTGPRLADDAVADDELADRQLPGIEAAPTSRARAVAAARRSTSQASATHDEPPVTLMPSSRATFPTTQRLARTTSGSCSAPARAGGTAGCVDEHGDVAVESLGARGNEAHARQRHVELLGHQHGQRGVHALAHLAAVHGEHHGAVGGDADPAVQADLAVRPAAALSMPPTRSRGGSTLQPTSSAPLARRAPHRSSARRLTRSSRRRAAR